MRHLQLELLFDPRFIVHYTNGFGTFLYAGGDWSPDALARWSILMSSRSLR